MTMVEHKQLSGLDNNHAQEHVGHSIATGDEREKQSTMEEVKTTHLPIDKGWAWFVLAGGIIPAHMTRDEQERSDDLIILAADNWDHNESTLSGKKSTHAMTSILVHTPSSGERSAPRIPRVKERSIDTVELPGTTLFMIIHGGIRKNYGILFVAIQTKFGSSASLTSLLTTMHNLVMSFSSLIITALGMQFMSKRTSIMLGALSITVAHIISAFATDLRLLFLSIGFLEGFGIALTNPAVIATLGEYFDKRRGLANGLAFSGASFGGLLFAPIFSTLFTDYGYTGTYMIVAGLTLNILVTSALLRPINSFERHKQTSESINCKTNSKKILVNTEEDEKLEPLLDTKFQDTKSGSPLLPRARALSLGSREPQPVSHSNQLLQLNSSVQPISRSCMTLFSSADGIYGSVIDTQDNGTGDNNTNDINRNTKSAFINNLKASFEVKLFKSPLFPMFLLMAAMLVSTSYLIPLFIAPLAKDIGLSSEQTGILMSIAYGIGMFSRIMCALFADKKFIRLTTLLAVVSILAGITAHCARLFTSFPLLVLMAVIIGLCSDIYLSMYPVVLVEYLTLPKLKTCIGFTILCHGLSVAGTFFVIGSLRDLTGSYYASYHFLGTMSFAGAAFALSLPYFHRRQQQTEVK